MPIREICSKIKIFCSFYVADYKILERKKVYAEFFGDKGMEGRRDQITHNLKPTLTNNSQYTKI